MTGQFFDTMIVASIQRVVIMTHQNLRLRKWWKLFWATFSVNNLCLLEWDFKTCHSHSSILFGKTMWRLNQISQTYSFESIKISIWFGACKMGRLNQALFTALE